MTHWHVHDDGRVSLTVDGVTVMVDLPPERLFALAGAVAEAGLIRNRRAEVLQGLRALAALVKK